MYINLYATAGSNVGTGGMPRSCLQNRSGFFYVAPFAILVIFLCPLAELVY